MRRYVSRGAEHFNDDTPMIKEAKQAFSVAEFCSRYGISRASFYIELKRGRLQARKIGRKTIILRADAERWATSLPVLTLRASA
jgi:predicted DNA-binding transcriptional regulator AlpA